MKDMFHFCVSSSGNEIMFRSEEDYNNAFNCLAISLFKTGSSLFADSFMSTHLHSVVETEQLTKLVQLFRISYNKYFNNKYCREGPLGDRYYYSIPLHGLRHILAAESYVFRNSVHHGVCTTPFEYKHSSVNCIFQEELGKHRETNILSSRSEIKKFLSHRASFPDSYQMNENGLFLRESVIQTSSVERQYATPKGFIYFMNRLSGEEWEKEQEKDDNNSPPITLESIEAGTMPKYDNEKKYMADLLRNEKSRFVLPMISDIDLCALVDTKLIQKYHKESVYLLSEGEKRDIAKVLIGTYHATEKQVQRCLVL